MSLAKSALEHKQETNVGVGKKCLMEANRKRKMEEVEMEKRMKKMIPNLGQTKIKSRMSRSMKDMFKKSKPIKEIKETNPYTDLNDN